MSTAPVRSRNSGASSPPMLMPLSVLAGVPRGFFRRLPLLRPDLRPLLWRAGKARRRSLSSFQNGFQFQNYGDAAAVAYA